MKPALVLQDVTKIFRTYHHYHAGLKALVLSPALLLRRRDKDTFLAVDRVSFTVDQGETFGIIGRNGAGKSTVLALIGGILQPSSGIVSVQGRISPLLELGVGFTPELTGRENIIINGVLLGLRRREIEEHINEIIEFSGLHSFIDQPLKTYSSGMQIRLGFAIAIHVQPDILLVDEVLAVGDAEFQEKCFERITTLRKQNVTIVFVSHNLHTLESICNRAAYIDKGRLAAIGMPREVISQYQADLSQPNVIESQRAGLSLRSKRTAR
jgi:lipopolysaccharide transport system ATP-binding protein